MSRMVISKELLAEMASRLRAIADIALEYGAASGFADDDDGVLQLAATVCDNAAIGTFEVQSEIPGELPSGMS